MNYGKEIRWIFAAMISAGGILVFQKIAVAQPETSIEEAPPEEALGSDEASDSPDSPEAPAKEAESHTPGDSVHEEPAVIELDDDEDEDELDGVPAHRIAQVDVIGRQRKRLDRVPGSAYILTMDDLKNQRALSGNEALRTVPGVHVRDEEGIGLRANIGLRGLNPDRSRSVLVLEDGVPVALAPYGEPELYYTPMIDRMQRVEVVKGSGSILWGPQTIGGVINYITLDPPEDFTVTAEGRVGSYGYGHGEVSVGDSNDGVGYRLSLMRTHFEGPRLLGLERTDATGKLKLTLSPTSYLGVKVQVYDEISSATYLGLTRPQYEADPSANYAIYDKLPMRRYGLAITHSALIAEGLLLQTTLYGNLTTRYWRRQDFDRSHDDARSYERIIDGQGRNLVGTEEALLDDGSTVYFRNGTGNRNRAFTVGGIESRATWDYGIGDQVKGELIGGLRLHYEQASEQRLDGQHGVASSGDLREDELRTGVAFAGYLQNRFSFWDRLNVSPGVRFEHLSAERKILRQRVEGTPTDLLPSVKSNAPVTAFIPGLGIAYQVLDPITMFGGVHRGFAPPRTKDALTREGTNMNLEAEYSWNYELGVRVDDRRAIRGELTGFLLDFKNQVIAPSEAGGAIADDTRALINGGASTHRGAEASVTVDSARLAGQDYELPLTINYTWVNARFGDGWKDEWVGNRLPYAPEHMLSTQLRFVHPFGMSVHVNGHYLSEQYTDADNTEELTIDGLRGKLDARFVIDAGVAYTHHPWGVTAYVAGKNLTDQIYIASLAPSGIQPAGFRQVFGGLRGEF